MVSTEPLDFNITIRKNPQKLIPYLYHIQAKVKQLSVTAKYYELCKAANDANTRTEQKEIWTAWKFKFVKIPSFKLMPLNKIKRHFIRIDMKSLYELGICILGKEKIEYTYKTDMLNPKVKTSIGGIDYIQVRKSKLPEDNKYLSVFYNENQNEQLIFKHITKQDLNSPNQWWLSDVLDIYSKNAKIRQLQRETVVRCNGDLQIFECLKCCLDDKSWNPWIPGASFLTDGVQVKLPLVSMRNDRTRGVDGLFKRGYTAMKENVTDCEIKLNNVRKGIYHESYDNLSIDDADNFVFMGIDPGRIRPLSACTISGDALPKDSHKYQLPTSFFPE